MASGKRQRAALFETPDWADLIAVRAVRLGDAFLTRLAALLNDFGITPLQFNVLRILYVRDVEGEGLPVGSIGALLVTSTPDVSRLIDRLEKQGLLERIRQADDRRVVRVRLTDEGFALVERIQPPIVAHHHALLAEIPKDELERIARALERVLDRLTK